MPEGIGGLWIQMLAAVGVTAGLHELDRRALLGKPGRRRTIIIGILYGLMGILFLSFSIDFPTADAEVSKGALLVSARDLAPLAAGLFFEPFSGLIAGTVSALFRMVTEISYDAFWPDVLSLSLGVFLPGLVSFFLGKFLFRREIPNPLSCMAVGLISEVLCFLSVMETFSNSSAAGQFIQSSLLPIFLPVIAGMFLISLLFTARDGKLKELFRKRPLSDTPIASTFKKKLLIVISGVFIFTMFLTVLNEDYYTRNRVDNSMYAAAGDLEDTLDRIGSDPEELQNAAAERHAGSDGAIYILENGRTVSTNSGTVPIGATLQEIGLAETPEDKSLFTAELDSTECRCYAVNYGKRLILLGIPVSDILDDMTVSILSYLAYDILLFAALFIGVDILMDSVIVRSLRKVNHSLEKITDGNLEEKVTAEESREFTKLSKDINLTVTSLKTYISEAENRINAELEFAKEIQYSALPSAVPMRKEFRLSAYMGTAKEVGGDFYDFFLPDEKHLVLIIADVSGKGIPAALFMMKSKTLLRNLAETGRSPAGILKAANNELCDGNEAEMFVTAWIGILDLATGVMTCANAGHEYPAVMRKDGDYELLKDKHGMVLGGLPGTSCSEYTMELKPGDRLFVYTDGVTEAANSQLELYGTGRMLEALNRCRILEPKEQLDFMKKQIDDFAGEAPQFDDITMISFIMTGYKEDGGQHGL